MKGVCCNNGNGQRCSVLFLFILVVILVSSIVSVVDGFMISTASKVFGSSNSQITKLSFLVRNKPIMSSLATTTARSSTRHNNDDDDEGEKKTKVAIIGLFQIGRAHV